MKLTIESTDEITTVNGCPVRYWRGTSDRGTQCRVFIAMIAVEAGTDSFAFEAELTEHDEPREMRHSPLANILGRTAL